MKHTKNSHASSHRIFATAPFDAHAPLVQDLDATPSCQVRLNQRKTGRWNLSADETSMRVIAAMLRNSAITPRDTDDPLTKTVARRVLRAFRLARCF